VAAMSCDGITSARLRGFRGAAYPSRHNVNRAIALVVRHGGRRIRHSYIWRAATSGLSRCMTMLCRGSALRHTLRRNGSGSWPLQLLRPSSAAARANNLAAV